MMQVVTYGAALASTSETSLACGSCDDDIIMISRRRPDQTNKLRGAGKGRNRETRLRVKKSQGEGR